MCLNCSQRPPRFQVRGGEPKQDSTHNLCLRCWKESLESIKQKEKFNHVPSAY